MDTAGMMPDEAHGRSYATTRLQGSTEAETCDRMRKHEKIVCGSREPWLNTFVEEQKQNNAKSRTSPAGVRLFFLRVCLANFATLYPERPPKKRRNERIL